MQPRITDIVRRAIRSDRKKSVPLRDIKRRMMLGETGSELCDRVEELLRESGLVPPNEAVCFGNSSGVSTLKGFVMNLGDRKMPAAVPPTVDETDDLTGFSDLGSMTESVGASGTEWILEQNRALRGGVEWIKQSLLEVMRGSRQLTPQDVVNMLDRVIYVSDNVGRQAQPDDDGIESTHTGTPTH
jgi:hypothetical protein